MNRKEQIDQLISKMNAESLQAVKRLENLFDPYSFVELGAFNEKAGVVTGYGLINGKQVYAYCQCGPVGTQHATKIGKLYKLATMMGSPIIGIMDAEGVKVSDGIDALEAYGSIFTNQSNASGVVPQISIVLGDCIGMSSFMPIIADFVIMPKTNAKMFMTSPAVIPGVDGRKESYESIGGGETLAKEGLVHCLCENEEECLVKARNLIDLLPENNLEGIVPSECNDDLNRTDASLDSIVPEGAEDPIDVRKIITSVADNNIFTEIYKEYAPNIITGFAKFGGITVGIIANNGVIRVDATKKAAEMVGMCDAFNIPILTFTDILGYEHTLKAEKKGIMKYSARLMSYMTAATVPRVNIILRNAIGSAYLLMNSKHIGADIVYAWPSAIISMIEKNAGIEVLNIDSDEYDSRTNPYAVASKGYVDTVIIPSNTRKRIISAMNMLITKRDAQPVRKHSSIEY